ncbi:MAG: hypothetical protein ABIJ41_01310 [Candidatus Omnitrophota bacterium]
MKKCLRCEVTFDLVERVRCLYCDSLLVDIGSKELAVDFEGSVFRQNILQENEKAQRQRIQHLVENYFSSRSFPFIYAYDRNQWEMGRNKKQLLVQPLNLFFILKIPWIFVNMIDSCYLHFFYTGYCPECNWKLMRVFREARHSEQDCSYNLEYATLLRQISTGEIISAEKKFEEIAQRKIKEGKRSAYVELCSRKRDFEVFLDFAVIWISIGLWVFLFIKLIMPIFARIYSFGEYAF